ncbi:MAG TPA: SDR family NAD(P)-dependent oxidoreductase [Polyangiaceae bacterium]|jgi:NAD(P)-dependent dehydrogenase (short-subunit alcohol dehydrogenase family)|nr:SDR family NAD(P)-dependent oxidoreductase [Polyangiaceae bacterium]
MNEQQRVALVTGVGRKDGIGFEVARQLAQRGFGVALTARTEDKARALAEALRAEGLDVRPITLDVSNDTSRRSAVARVREEFDALDVLVNNAAGSGRMGEKVETANLDDARAAFEATVLGSWGMAQAMLPLLRESRHPRIVNVSSGAGSHGDNAFGLRSANGMGPSYAVAKAALNARDASSATARSCPGEETTDQRLETVQPPTSKTRWLPEAVLRHGETHVMF